MKLAVDTSALLAIFNAEKAGEAWLDLLVRARSTNRLVICEVVFAELSPSFSNRDQLDGVLAKMGILTEPIGRDAAWLAGKTFQAYRRRGGPREHLIPDFLIAAHARVHADRLAAVDRGYLRRYFPELHLMGLG
ncbi:MAG: type II toxin-antitoxin system VapC family toxin [Holophagales bacterium]|nr:type II toxin-antitoxin system VapC family toxin [Holophagales bacterium]